MSPARSRLAAGCLTLVAGLLLLWNLGAPILWEDEAETALLARNTLRFGWPRATGGDRGVISQQCGEDYEAATGRWIRHPWGPALLTAGSFALLGESSFTARLPHALLALACVPATLLLARRFGLRGRAAWLAPWLLVLSVTFAHYGRQCRYHSMAMLGTAVALAALPGLQGPRWRRERLWLASGLFLLLESSYLLFAAVFAGLALAGPLLLRDAASRKRLAMTLGAFALLALPLLWAQGFFSGAAAHAGTLGDPAAKFWGYLLKLDLFFLPLSALALAGIMVAVRPKDRPPVLPEGKRVAAFFAAFLVVNLAVATFSTVAFSRYLSHLLPAFALATALALLAIRRTLPLLATVVTLLLVPTISFHGWLARCLTPAGLNLQRLIPSPLLFTLATTELPGRLRHGPLTDTIRFLNGTASPKDTVFITHGDLPLRFHTRLRVLGGESGEDPRGAPPPEWVVWREFFRMRPRTPGAVADQQRMREFLASLPWERYEAVPCSPFDTVWDNSAEPEVWMMIPPRHPPRVAIFRLRDAGR